MTHLLTTPSELSAYDTWVRSHPAGSLWQSLAWKTYQEALGREVRIYVVRSDEVTKCESVISAKVKEERMLPIASALVVIDRTVGGYSVWEIPRGPLLSDEVRKCHTCESDEEVKKCESEEVRKYKELLDLILVEAKKDSCMTLFLSPSQKLSPTILSTDALSHIRTSARHVYPQATRIIDLKPPEVDILAQMHPKGRYNIGRAEKHGVTVREGSRDDIDIFYGLLKQTGSRDGFTIAQKSHYARFLEALDGSFLLIAEHEKKPIAGLLGVVWPAPTPNPSPLRGEGNTNTARGGKGIYYYGASSYEDRSLMAPYLLQREAMRYAKNAGCTSYDLLGISKDDAPLDDPWRGITDFKRKFGGTVALYPPEQMVVLRPFVKKVIEWKRGLIG